MATCQKNTDLIEDLQVVEEGLLEGSHSYSVESVCDTQEKKSLDLESRPSKQQYCNDCKYQSSG